MNSNSAPICQQFPNAKPIFLLASVVSLTLSAVSIAPSFAQPTPNTPPDQQLHQQNPLNLTPNQQAQMQQIWQSEQAQINQILTAEQKDRLASARQNQADPRQALESLNLTNDQKTKIQALYRRIRKQMERILTPEQLQQLQQSPPPPQNEPLQSLPDPILEQQAKWQQIQATE